VELGCGTVWFILSDSCLIHLDDTE